jgi:transcriptional regulator with XRE-family HTH domain
VRLPCRLREARGDRTLREMSELAGVAQPHLSEIERGWRVPRDEWIEGLEAAYGVPVTEFYASRLTVQLEPDGGEARR